MTKSPASTRGATGGTGKPAPCPRATPGCRPSSAATLGRAGCCASAVVGPPIDPLRPGADRRRRRSIAAGGVGLVASRHSLRRLRLCGVAALARSLLPACTVASRARGKRAPRARSRRWPCHPAATAAAWRRHSSAARACDPGTGSVSV